MDVQEELDGVLHWIAALLILLLQWLYPKAPQSHTLSRMFYDHLTLSHDLTYCLHPIYILTLLYACRVLDSVFKCMGNLFLFLGSHNNEEWREVDSIMYKEGKVYMPKDNMLRVEIIRLHHNTPVEGHGGQWKTVELVTQNFWWPEVTREVKQYIEGCDSCQRNKNRIEQPAGKLMPNSIPEKPWMHISADFITKLPIAQGYDLILVIVDRLTKMVHFISITEKTLAEGLARLFRDNVWKLHGLLL